MDEASVFHEALLRVAPADRAADLERACAGDDGLRREVELLLKAHDRAGDFLDRRRRRPGQPRSAERGRVGMRYREVGVIRFEAWILGRPASRESQPLTGGPMRKIQGPTSFTPPPEKAVMAAIHREQLWPEYVTHKPGVVSPDHYHQTDEWLWLLEGEMQFTDKHGTYDVRAGQQLFIPEGTVHSVKVGARGATYIMGLRERIPTKDFSVYLPPDRPEFAELVEVNYSIAERENTATEDDKENFFEKYLSKDLRFVRVDNTCVDKPEFLQELEADGQRVSRHVDLKALGGLAVATLFVDVGTDRFLNVRVFRKEEDGRYRLVRWMNVKA